MALPGCQLLGLAKQGTALERGEPGVELLRPREADERGPDRLGLGWRRLNQGAHVAGELALRGLDGLAPGVERRLLAWLDRGDDDLGDAAEPVEVRRALPIRAVEPADPLFQQALATRCTEPGVELPGRAETLDRTPLARAGVQRNELDAEEARLEAGGMRQPGLPAAEGGIRAIADTQPRRDRPG